MKLLPLKAKSLEGRCIITYDDHGRPKAYTSMEQHLLLQTPTEEFRKKLMAWEAKVFWGIDIKP